MFEVEFYQRTQATLIARLLETLMYAENEPQHRNDVLYIQTADAASVPALVELAEQWQVDRCEIDDRTWLAIILGHLGRSLSQSRAKIAL